MGQYALGWWVHHGDSAAHGHLRGHRTVPAHWRAYALDVRTATFYYATGVTPAMRLPDIGFQYLMAFQDTDKNDFNGAKTYKVTLPPNTPAAKF